MVHGGMSVRGHAPSTNTHEQRAHPRLTRPCTCMSTAESTRGWLQQEHSHARHAHMHNTAQHWPCAPQVQRGRGISIAPTYMHTRICERARAPRMCGRIFASPSFAPRAPRGRVTYIQLRGTRFAALTCSPLISMCRLCIFIQGCVSRTGRWHHATLVALFMTLERGG